jgi:hypothetical protein
MFQQVGEIVWGNEKSEPLRVWVKQGAEDESRYVEIDEILTAVLQELPAFHAARNASRNVAHKLGRCAACRKEVVAMGAGPPLTLLRLSGVFSFFGLDAVVEGTDMCKVFAELIGTPTGSGRYMAGATLGGGDGAEAGSMRPFIAIY